MEDVNSVTFRRLLGMLTARWYLIVGVTITAVATAVAIEAVMPPTYTATTTLLVDFEQPVRPASEPSLAAMLQEPYLATQMGIISSRPVVTRAVDELDLASDPVWQAAYTKATGLTTSPRDWIIGQVTKHLSITSPKNTRLVTINYTSEDQKSAPIIANAIAKAYQETNLDLETQPAGREALEIKKNLEEMRIKLEQAQERLTAYEKEHGILMTDERLGVEADRLKEIVKQRSDLSAKTIAIEEKLKTINNANSRLRLLESLPEVQTSDVIRDLKGEISSKEREFQEVRGRLGASHPSYKAVESELRVLRERLAAELRSIADGIRSEHDQAKGELAALGRAELLQREAVMKEKSSRDGLPTLIRDQEAAKSDYEAGLSAYNAFLSQSRLTQTNVSVINPAIPQTTAPAQNAESGVAIAAFLGLVLGMAAAIVWELIDLRIRSRKDFDDVAEQEETLGWIPRHH